MKEEFPQIIDEFCSCLQVEVEVTETWINFFMDNQQLKIPINDKYNLHNVSVNLETGKLCMIADIQEIEGSSIEITCSPKWDEAKQQILLEDLQIDTVSKNILLKSAGWFVNTFMSAKMDKKIEEVTTALYAQQMQNILSNGINFPMKNGGSANVEVKSIMINEMLFLDHSIKVKAMVEGHFKLKLDTKA